MKKRIITAACLFALLVGVIAFKLLTNYVFDAFIVVLMGIIAYECSGVLTKGGKRNFPLASIFFAPVVFVSIFLCIFFNLTFYYIFLVLLGTMLVYYLLVFVVAVSIRDTKKMQNLANATGKSVDKTAFSMSINSMLCGVYSCILPSFFILLNHLADLTIWKDLPCDGNVLSFVLLAFAFLIPIITDTFAMFGGMLLKGPKLIPSVSPNKTVSGAVTGLCMAMLACAGAYLALCEFAVTFEVLVALRVNILNMLLLGMLASIAGQCGDLLESHLKRRANVKDVSNILPGHGGVMDRIDSHIFSAPVVFIFFMFFLI